jgi:hypothetical protein
VDGQTLSVVGIMICQSLFTTHHSHIQPGSRRTSVFEGCDKPLSRMPPVRLWPPIHTGNWQRAIGSWELAGIHTHTLDTHVAQIARLSPHHLSRCIYRRHPSSFFFWCSLKSWTSSNSKPLRFPSPNFSIVLKVTSRISFAQHAWRYYRCCMYFVLLGAQKSFRQANLHPSMRAIGTIRP